MPEFFLELFSEEIPARMQRGAAEQLREICGRVFAGLSPEGWRSFYGPRRIAIAVEIGAETQGGTLEARGPRDSAPEAALAGFLGKYQARREELVAEGGYFWLRRAQPPVPSAELIRTQLVAELAKFAWPKSMRWGGSDNFTWVRPLRRIVCLLDGEVIPFQLGPVTASNETEGHRVLAPGAFMVASAADWEAKLQSHYVVADAQARRQEIAAGLAREAAARKLTLVEDPALLDEVTGLVEWPVPLIGTIGAAFMSLPPEVRELSMRVNQKYFALRDAGGAPAPSFAFVANLAAPDHGAAIIAGNERVLRARLADAQHFWKLDLQTPLDALLPKLEQITFHAKIGTQRQRADRIAALAAEIAKILNAEEPTAKQAYWAGLLAKADLVTGMVGEFPELQGVMGGYYAEQSSHGWDGSVVGPAIRTHYQPKGPGDAVPASLVPASVALADKLDTLREFFRIGETPTGSGDPYALRRAALGVIRIILENELRLNLKPLLQGNAELFGFMIERLRVKLRGEGRRFDVLDAVLAAAEDDDLVRIMKRVNALADMLGTEDGQNLLSAYRRAANILRIEDAKDGPHSGEPDNNLFEIGTAERELNHAMFMANGPQGTFRHAFATEDFGFAMQGLATMRHFIDSFFGNVTVNAPEPELRRNRLQLLAQFRDTVNQIADFSKIEG